MKRLLYFVAVVSILMFSCSIPGTPTPVVATETPTATEPPPVQNNVTCNELSFYLDPALASGVDCKTVPESSGADVPGFELYPGYTEATLQGYVLADRFFTPHIAVFPVQRYRELAPDVIPDRVTALQALIGGGAVGTNALPLLPIFNAAQEFYAHYQVVPFASGSGIRYLTQYSQYADPVNNNEMFYSFQGLTGDGRYWISAILPISSPILAADSSTIPGGVSEEEFSNNFHSYITDITEKLNAQAPSAFSPSLADLDALIASLTIQP